MVLYLAHEGIVLTDPAGGDVRLSKYQFPPPSVASLRSLSPTEGERRKGLQPAEGGPPSMSREAYETLANLLCSKRRSLCFPSCFLSYSFACRVITTHLLDCWDHLFFPPQYIPPSLPSLPSIAKNTVHPCTILCIIGTQNLHPARTSLRVVEDPPGGFD